MKFPKDYPMCPPFVRIVRPRFQFLTGIIIHPGSCDDSNRSYNLTSINLQYINDISVCVLHPRSCDSRWQYLYGATDKVRVAIDQWYWGNPRSSASRDHVRPSCQAGCQPRPGVLRDWGKGRIREDGDEVWMEQATTSGDEIANTHTNGLTHHLSYYQYNMLHSPVQHIFCGEEHSCIYVVEMVTCSL